MKKEPAKAQQEKDRVICMLHEAVEAQEAERGALKDENAIRKTENERLS